MKKILIINRTAFTLVELLVVISIIGLLMAILIPALAAAKSETRSLVCKHNIRQLLIASISYADENNGFYVAAASDMWDQFGGKHRWHGVRNSPDEPFEPNKGPMVSYLADGKVKECPAKVKYIKGQIWNESFEKGCGGYGYNMAYLGSRLWRPNSDNSPDGWKRPYAETTHILEVKKPGETLMFADTAYDQKNNLIEYSFAEPPHFVMYGRVSGKYAKPSIHFRHREQANIGWVDGSVDSRKIAKFDEKVQSVTSYNLKLSWFEPLDNTPFDLE